MGERRREKRRVSYLQGKVSHGHCNRQVEKPPGLHSHLNEPTRRDLLKFHVAVGRAWGRNKTKPGCPAPLHLSECLSFILSLVLTASLPGKETHSQTF